MFLGKPGMFFWFFTRIDHFHCVPRLPYMPLGLNLVIYGNWKKDKS